MQKKSAPGLIYPTIGKDFFLKYNVENKLDNAELNYIGNDGFFYAIAQEAGELVTQLNCYCLFSCLFCFRVPQRMTRKLLE